MLKIRERNKQKNSAQAEGEKRKPEHCSILYNKGYPQDKPPEAYLIIESPGGKELGNTGPLYPS